jgi:hypothetical protein
VFGMPTALGASGRLLHTARCLGGALDALPYPGHYRDQRVDKQPCDGIRHECN